MSFFLDKNAPCITYSYIENIVTSLHLIGLCPAFEWKRQQVLGAPFLEPPLEGSLKVIRFLRELMGNLQDLDPTVLGSQG